MKENLNLRINLQKLSEISLQMSSLSISPTKADKFGIKIAKMVF